MESNSEHDQHLRQLTMISDSGGIHKNMPTPPHHHQPHHQVIDSPTSGTSVLSYHPVSSGGSSADSIGAVLDAAVSICDGDASAGGATSEDATQRLQTEEGIIYRNPGQTALHNAGNSKMHFISNLTLIAKQQQQGAAGPAQNIIFLNNTGHQSSAGKLTPSTAAPSYVNAFVSKGVSTTKVSNLLSSTAKGMIASGRGKPMNALNRQQAQPTHRNLTVIGRSVGTRVQATQNNQNLVITGPVAAAIGPLKSNSNDKTRLNPGPVLTTTAAKVLGRAWAEGPKLTATKFSRGGGYGNVTQGRPKHVASKYHEPKCLPTQNQIPPSQCSTETSYTSFESEEPTAGQVKGKFVEASASLSSVVLVSSSSSSNGGHALQNAPNKVVLHPRNSSAKISAAHEEAVLVDEQLVGSGKIKYVSAQGNVVNSTVQHSGAGGKRAPAAGQEAPEEVFYVNGTQMNDEMSARLLHNFSQKVTGRFVQQQSTHPIGSGVKYQYSSAKCSSNAEYGRTRTSSQTTANDHHDARSALDGNNNTGSGSNRLVNASYVTDTHPHLQVQGQEEASAVEVRPAPILATDERSKALHAVLQDHTYVLLRPASDQKPGVLSAEAMGQQNQHFQSYHAPLTTGNFDKHELGIAIALADVGNRSAQRMQPVKCTTTDLLNAAMGLGHFPRDDAMDDDNCSVISNDSRSGRGAAGDNDAGEETETAPEGEGEDDSVTRCICDLTHDDGYMICCDKCSTWQHVDCMGIDRMNIPDEYKCDICQPRPMDKNRARTLQLLKRREQQNLVNVYSLGLGHPSAAVGGAPVVGSPLAGQPIYGTHHVVPPPPNDLLVPAEGYCNKIGGTSPTKKTTKAPLGARRKSELGPAFASKKPKRDLSKNGGASGKRKDKKLLSKKRSTSLASNNKQVPGPYAAMSAEDKLSGGAAKAWADNYETAMTNHYSPELRARLQTISKQHQQVLLSPTAAMKSPPMSNTYSGQTTNLNLRNVGDLTGKCTTVPHAGGKILISTLELAAGDPIVELRGKYMLSGQYRQHNSIAPNRLQTGKPPTGPFIFFYRMASDATEICVDTRTYGNDARFVRRSCRPNAEIVHHLEKGTIHLYLVSLQPIRASTEITIKHEAHDLVALAKPSPGDQATRSVATPCGCGLVKDCLFYNANLNAIPTAASSDGVVRYVKQRFNGNLQKLRTTSRTGVGDDQHTGPVRRSSKANQRHSRSTSSSGESNAGLLSPGVVGSCSGDASYSNFVGTSGVHPVQSPRQEPVLLPPQADYYVDYTVVKEEAKECVGDDIAKGEEDNSIVVVVVKKEEEQQGLCPEMVTDTTPSGVLVAPKKEEVVAEDTELIRDQGPIKKEYAESSETSYDVDKSIALLDSPVQEQSPSGGAYKSAELSAAVQKKNKELKSLSEENLKATPTRGGTCEESRKLTREERKMEAIMKAFEKMEKSSMRKQEGGRKASSDGMSSCKRGGSGRREGEDMFIFKKKKRKGSKSYQQAGPRRARKKSGTVGQDDAFTSDDSNGSLLSSPPISSCSSYPMRPSSFCNFEPHSVPGEQDSAASMLLSLANATPAAGAEANTRHDLNSGPLSSAFMLVEAAIAPLEAASDFKMPKTKKSIMNEWLTADKSNVFSPGQSQETFDSLVQVACGEIPLQPECRRSDDSAVSGSCEGQSQDSRCTVSSPFGNPPSVGGSESAVKKRWLRQAISEECSDEAPASPTNGYSATPLKKRRFARECSQVSAGMFSPEPSSMANSPVEGVEVVDCTTHGDRVDAAVEGDIKTQEEKSAKEESAVDSLEPPTRQNEEAVGENEPRILEQLSSTEDDRTAAASEVENEPQQEQEQNQSIPTISDHEEQETRNLCVEKKAIIPEEFDIEPLNPGTVSGEDGNDEIADIQKRLHSFHAENILFLKSMNKKNKSNPSPITSENLSAYSSASVSASSSATCSPNSSPRAFADDPLFRRHSSSSSTGTTTLKRKKLNFDALPELHSAPTFETDSAATEKWPKRRTKSRFSSPVLPTAVELDLNSNTVVGAAKPKESSSESSPTHSSSHTATEAATMTTATHSYFTSAGAAAAAAAASSSYSNGAGHLMQMPLINTSIPPPNLPYPSLFSSAFGVPLTDQIPRTDQSSVTSGGVQAQASSSRLLLSELLENATTAGTLASLCSPSGFLSLNSTPNSKLLFNSETTPNSASATHNQLPTSGERVLIRTASADPRLNPHLASAPESASVPKRKLSINEYRKRKQGSQSGCSGECSAQSPAAMSASQVDGSAAGFVLADDKCDTNLDECGGLSPSRRDPILDSLCDSNSCASPPSPEVHPMLGEKGTFSAAPTLLERQQESISERLKSYKSVTELLTTKDGSPIIKTILQNNPLVGSSIIESLRSSINVAEEVTQATTAEGDRDEDAHRSGSAEGGQTEDATVAEAKLTATTTTTAAAAR